VPIKEHNIVLHCHKGTFNTYILRVCVLSVFHRSVGIRLGRGEKLEDILSSSSQVAEGVATAGVVVGLARKYRVSLPVLTAVAQVLDNNLTPAQAVTAVMNLPQIDEM
jgi:glycerol-3-phosphate dehydrogenase (NAD+)